MSRKPHCVPESLVIALPSESMLPVCSDKSLDYRAVCPQSCSMEASSLSLGWGTEAPRRGTDLPNTLRRCWAVGLILEAPIPLRASQAPTLCLVRHSHCPALTCSASAGNSAISTATSASQDSCPPRADAVPGESNSQDLCGDSGGGKKWSGWH